MARGRIRGHRGERKQFSNPIEEDLSHFFDDVAEAEEMKKEDLKRKKWREAHPNSKSKGKRPPPRRAGGKKEKKG